MFCFSLEAGGWEGLNVPTSQLKIALSPVPLGSKDSNFLWTPPWGELSRRWDILSYSQLNRNYVVGFLEKKRTSQVSFKLSKGLCPAWDAAQLQWRVPIVGGQGGTGWGHGLWKQMFPSSQFSLRLALTAVDRWVCAHYFIQSNLIWNSTLPHWKWSPNSAGLTQVGSLQHEVKIINWVIFSKPHQRKGIFMTTYLRWSMQV